MLKHSGRFMKRLLIFTLFYLSLPGMAYAYIDPGNGSYVLQLIIGVLFGALLMIKAYWKAVKAFFVNLFSIKSRTKKDVHSKKNPKLF